MNNFKKTLSEKISQRIQQENLKPVSKNFFIFRRIVIWVILLLSILVSSGILSMIFFRIGQIRKLPYEFIPLPIQHQIFDMVPLIFFVTLSIGVVVAIYEFTQTSKGYKFEKLKIGFCVLILVIILGIVFSYTGIHRFVHATLVDRLQTAPSIEQIKDKRFNHPNKGMIIGVVKENILTNREGEDIHLISGKNIELEEFVNIENLEQPVVLFGKLTPDNSFIVCKIGKQKKELLFEKPKPFYSNTCI